MRNLIVILSWLIATQIYAQNDSTEIKSIDSLAFIIANKTSRMTKQFSLNLDSVSVSIKKFEDKIETQNRFPSGSSLTIVYYLNRSKPFLVNVREQCPTNNEFSNYTDFYFRRGKIKKMRNYHNVSTCIPIRPNENLYQAYGYNENLNPDFLKLYVTKLYDVMANHR